MHKRRWLVYATHVAGLTPLVVLAALALAVKIGPDPVGSLLHATGRGALIFLLLSLVPTAVRIVSGYAGLLSMRRWLGLYAFLYAFLHLAILVGLDYAFNLRLLWLTLREGPAIILGLLAFVLLAPLAITSTDRWMRRLGRGWRRLHRLAYLAAAFAAAHYAAVFKELRTLPLLAAATLALLLALRVWAYARARSRAQQVQRAALLARSAVAGTKTNGRPATPALVSPRYTKRRIWWAFVIFLLLLAILLYFIGLETWEYWALVLAAVLVGWWRRG